MGSELLMHFQLLAINNTGWKSSWTNLADSWCPQVLEYEAKTSSRDHIYLFISLSQALIPNRTRHSKLRHLSKQRMHYLQVGPFHCQCVINAALKAVCCMIILVGGKGCLQERFGAVLFCIILFLCAAVNRIKRRIFMAREEYEENKSKRWMYSCWQHCV